jgi:beta-glucanase (GH16 family)
MSSDKLLSAVNLHYYATDDLEWYDPGNIITEGGYLAITLTSETLADSHGLGYLGGMLQSWNKFW